MYRSAALFGRDHTELGKIHVVEVTPQLAIGISRGRFPKGYPHTEPNEDAVFAGTDGETAVLAVADGHHGTEASHAAIAAVGVATEKLIGSLDMTDSLVRLAASSVRALDSDSDTALTIAVVTATDVLCSTFGDTSLITVGHGRATVRQGGGGFLVAAGTPVVLEPGGPSSLTAVVTDGISSFIDSRHTEIYQLSESDASGYVRRLCNEAFRGGAGDNLAVAALLRNLD